MRLDDVHPGGGDGYRINLTLTDPATVASDGIIVIDGYSSVISTAWTDPEDGTITGAASLGPFSYDPTGGSNTHVVAVTVTDSSGLTSSHDINVVVMPLPGMAIETFSGINDFAGWTVTSGLTYWLNGTLSVGRGTDAPSSISKTIALTEGETYTLSWDGNVRNGGTTYTVTAGGTSHSYGPASGWEHHEVQFVATGPEQIAFATPASSDQDAWIDNIAVTAMHHV